MSSQPNHRRWLTFRLRTLFLVIVALALFMGLFVVPRETRRHARNALIAREISVDLEDDPNDPVPYRMVYKEPVPQPFWIRWWYGTLPASYTREVRWVRPNKMHPFSQTDLQNIARLGKVNWLNIHQAIENPQWLRPLIQADNVRGTIHFWRCHVDGDILEQIGKLRNLTGLSFEDVPLDANLLSHIADMKQIESLVLKGTGCGNEAMEHVAGFRRLKRLRLIEANVTDYGLKQLSKLSQLERFRGEVNAGDEGFVCLKNMRNLIELRLTNTPITDRTLAHLSEATGLRQLGLEFSKVDGSGLHHLRNCRKLYSIELMGSPVYTGMATLAELPELYFVNLSQSQITNDELVPLGKSKSLVSLSLFDTQITDDGLQMLETIPTLDTARTNRSTAFRWTRGGLLRLKTSSP